MFINTHGSAPKRFAKFGRQKRTFCGKKEEELTYSSQTDYRYITMSVCHIFYVQSMGKVHLIYEKRSY